MTEDVRQNPATETNQSNETHPNRSISTVFSKSEIVSEYRSLANKVPIFLVFIRKFQDFQPEFKWVEDLFKHLFISVDNSSNIYKLQSSIKQHYR